MIALPVHLFGHGSGALLKPRTKLLVDVTIKHSRQLSLMSFLVVIQYPLIAQLIFNIATNSRLNKTTTICHNKLDDSCYER